MAGKHKHEDGKPAYGDKKSVRDSKYGLPVPDGLRKLNKSENLPEAKSRAAGVSPTKPLPHKLSAEQGSAKQLPVVPKPPKHGGVRHPHPANPLLKDGTPGAVKNAKNHKEPPLYSSRQKKAPEKPKPGTVEAANRTRDVLSAPKPKKLKPEVSDIPPSFETVTAPIHSTEVLSGIERRTDPISPLTPEDEMRLRREREVLKSRIKRQDVFNMSIGTITGIILVTLIIGVSALLSWVIVTSAIDFVGIEKDDYDIEVEIPDGASTEQIAKILRDNKIINKPELFVKYSKMAGKDGKYLHGLFTLSSTMSYNRIIYNLQKTAKSTVTVSVRVLEGMTGDDIGKLLEENGVCKATDFEYFYRQKQNDYNFEKRVNQDNMKYNQLEGYLYPDTYEFYVIEGFDDLEAREKMNTYDYAAFAASKIFSNYNDKISVDMYRRISDMNLTLDQFMTLASMVQKEAGTIDDMRKVASVFLNRLHNSSTFPLLQSDVTKLYADECIKPHLTERNVDYYKPMLDAYDTYTTPGLPPGPVSNPGMDAMNAVLNPVDTDYFYFNANIETGEVFFASDLAEHEANLAKVEKQQAVSVG
ncbi:hypothetical protein FACS1894120_0880 [Clostridia bacterium]|nr:hypothetical protein FACS1894120_0880 [Clostridia bacterium]